MPEPASKSRSVPAKPFVQMTRHTDGRGRDWYTVRAYPPAEPAHWTEPDTPVRCLTLYHGTIADGAHRALNAAALTMAAVYGSAWTWETADCAVLSMTPEAADRAVQMLRGHFTDAGR